MENQNLEMERLSVLLQEAKDTSKSQIEDMRKEHDVQISHGLAEVCDSKINLPVTLY